MRLSRRLNKSVVAVALTAGALLAPVVTTTASAQVCCGVDIKTTYYSTAAKTTIVGVFYDGGDCQPPYEWGQTTAYYTVQKIYCSTP